MSGDTRIAIVVPMYNEAPNIDRFIDRARCAADIDGLAATFIFVDDGSRDGSVALVGKRLRELPSARVVELTRNFGKEAALLAGLDAALELDCEAVLLIDADLQHPPEAIPAMVEAWRRGSDVVIASRASRGGDPRSRRVLTRLFYRSINWLSDISIVDGDGDFRLMDRPVVEALCELREQHRFMKGLYTWVGFRQTRIAMDFEARHTGESKFRLGNLIGLAINAVTSFSIKPLRITLMLGFVIGAISLASAAWIALQTFIYGKQLPGYASIFCGMMFLGGLQLMGMGLLGEYVGRTYVEAKKRPPYLVRRVIREEQS